MRRGITSSTLTFEALYLQILVTAEMALSVEWRLPGIFDSGSSITFTRDGKASETKTEIIFNFLKLYYNIIKMSSMTTQRNWMCNDLKQVGCFCSFDLSCRLLDKRERNVLFNDSFNTFYLLLYVVRHMVKDHSDSEKGNPLPPHRLLLSINSKGSFICTTPETE